jgi:hypothetical protein
VARIETYVEDNQVTENDIILGTDGDNFNKTKNFRVAALANFLEDFNLDLKPKIVTTVVGQNETISDKFTNFNLIVTADDNPVYLVFLKDVLDSDTNETIIERYVYSFNAGTGIYQDITESQLTLLEKGNPTVEEVNELDNTTIIDLGVVSGGDFLSEINSAIPSYDLSDTEQTYFFTYEDSGVAYLIKFIGTNGLYGANDNTAVTGDFISFTNVDVDDDNIQAKYIEVTLGDTNYETEIEELEEVARQVNLLPSFIITEKQLFVIYSDSLQNDAGTSYRTVYICNTGKGTYGDGGTGISETNLIKVRGSQINENLSSYNNDANFTTTTDLDDKVDKAGDTMSGDLNMEGNKVVNIPTPTQNNDAVNKSYADSLVNFRGTYSTDTAIKNISSPSDGDYAYLSKNSVEQLWIYNTDWQLVSAKPYYLNVSNDLTINNSHHNATINIDSTSVTLTFPDGLEHGLNIFIRNYDGGKTIFTASGTATVSEFGLDQENLATVINNSDDFVIDVTGKSEYDRVNFGIYDYDATNPAITLTGGSFSTLNNNAAGANTFKNPVPAVSEIWNTSTNRFDFSNLKINDFVTIRLDLDITTASAGEVIDCELLLGEGQAGEYTIPFSSSKYYKNAGSYRFLEDVQIYIGNNLTKDNPALIQIKSSGNDDVTLNGFFVKVEAKTDI